MSNYKYFWSVVIVLILYVIIHIWADNVQIIQLDSGIPGPTVLIVGGTHGNEPAGTIAIEGLDIKPKNGKVILVPRANKLGLLLNTRWLPHRFINTDLNRNYPREEGEIPLEMISAKICKLADSADFIIDLHEGWGYTRLDSASLGSGLYPGNTREAIDISYRAVDKLNEMIDVPYKKFVVGLNNHPELNSLRSYCVLLGKHYILIETTGQNGIQPIDIRVHQHQFIIYSVLLDLDMI